MLKFIIIAVIAWILGVFGWAQIIGSLRNLNTRPNLFITMMIWIVIMGLGAYFAVSKFGGTAPLLVGYIASFIQVISQREIQ